MRKKSFTLIELLLVVAITTVMITSILGLLVSAKYSADLNEAQIEVKEYAQRALDRITKELRLSQPNKIRITNSVAWATETTSTGTAINFQIPVGAYNNALDLTSAYNLKWGSDNTEGHYLAYSLEINSNCVLRSDYVNADGSGAATRTIAPHITSLLFSRADTGSDFIHIEITASKTGPRGQISQALSMDIKLKNT